MSTTIRNGNLFCLNCGGEFVLKLPMAIKEMSKKTKAFHQLHKDCESTWKETTADQTKTIEERAIWWFANGERGMSSETMWHCFMNLKIDRVCHPHDPSDFSRCYKLLETVPEWKYKSNMLKLSKLSDAWSNLVNNWDKLTNMYEENERNDWKTHKEIGMFEFMGTLTKKT